MPTYDEFSEEEKLIPESTENATGRQRTHQAQRRLSDLTPRVSANISGLLLVISVTLACCALTAWFIDSNRKCEVEDWEYYSPIIKHIKLPFHTKQIDARLFPNATDPMAIFTAPPSHEVDNAWKKVSRNMILGLTESDLNRLGKDPATAVKFSPDWNISNGEEFYLGVVDVFHQIHCLNMLRQNLIMNYDYYSGEAYGFKPPVFRETHLMHCTSILLQNLMCHAELGVFTHVWRDGNPVPWPDFAINRQCRDFDALMHFRDTEDVEDSFDKFRFYTKRPEDAVLLPMEEGIAEMRATADEFRDGEYYKDLHIKGCSP